MAGKKRKKEFIKVCPNCGSDDSILTAFVYDAGNSVLKCKNCEYEGRFVEMGKKDIPKFISLIDKRHKNKIKNLFNRT